MVETSPRKRALFVLLAAVGGVLAATGSRMQGSLAHDLGDPFLAAVSSAIVPVTIFAIVICLTPRARAGVRAVFASVRGDGGLKWWHLIGGLGGTAFAISQGATVSALGVAVFIVAVVAGNSIGSLLVDARGLAPGGRRPITASRLLGPLLAVSAATVAVVGGGLEHTDSLWLAILPLGVGVFQAVQQAINGHVRAVASNAPGGRPSMRAGVIATNFLTFNLAISGMIVTYLVTVVIRGGFSHETFPANPAVYLGGVMAIGTASIGVAVVHRIGVLLLMLGGIAGQMIGAMVIDLIFSNGVSIATAVAAALTMLAVSIPLVGSRAVERLRRKAPAEAPLPESENTPELNPVGVK
ncbi:MAG: DMT family transporter [Promicromonosporaceae bacterium]|nr:DMT family transporter [Promicromonosporaceae bacterium]